MKKILEENQVGRDFVVGDLHGMYVLLEDLLDHVQFDINKDRLISVGDLIDRGNYNLDCLQLLDEDWFHCVKGNHEQLMQDYLTGGPTGSWWFHNGGGWWFDTNKDEVIRLLPRVESLPLMISTKTFHVLHAELHEVRESIITDEDLEDEAWFKFHALTHMGDGEAILWGRKLWGPLYSTVMDATQIRKMKKRLEILTTYFNPELSHIYSGHTTVRQPTTIGGQTNLDTGAFRVLREDEWAGLTMTEPATNRFWTAKEDGVHEVRPLVI